jgi:hypothetical protein
VRRRAAAVPVAAPRSASGDAPRRLTPDRRHGSPGGADRVTPRLPGRRRPAGDRPLRSSPYVGLDPNPDTTRATGRRV